MGEAVKAERQVPLGCLSQITGRGGQPGLGHGVIKQHANQM